MPAEKTNDTSAVTGRTKLDDGDGDTDGVVVQVADTEGVADGVADTDGVVEGVADTDGVVEGVWETVGDGDAVAEYAAWTSDGQKLVSQFESDGCVCQVLSRKSPLLFGLPAPTHTCWLYTASMKHGPPLVRNHAHRMG